MPYVNLLKEVEQETAAFEAAIEELNEEFAPDRLQRKLYTSRINSNRRIASALKHTEAMKRRLERSNHSMRKAKDDLGPEVNCVAISKLSLAIQANKTLLEKVE